MGLDIEANLRKRRIEAHFLIDQARNFEEVAEQVRGVGPLVRHLGRHVLPNYRQIRENPTLDHVRSIILAAEQEGRLKLE